MPRRIWIGCAVLLAIPSLLVAFAPLPKRFKEKPTPEVYAIGVYEGTSHGQRLPGVGRPAGHVSVKVAKGDKPVILVLSAYEPVVWNVDAADAKVVRVIASGYHSQTVLGVNRKVPVTRLSYDAGDKNYFFAYKKNANKNKANKNKRNRPNRKYERMVERIKELTELDVKDFQGKYTGDSFQVR